MSSKSHELYRGKAVIMNIEFEGAEDWKDWEKAKLSEADKLNAFKIVYDCAIGDANGERHDVKVEISHRELSGAMLEWYAREDGNTPTQIDVALRTLKQQGLLPRDANNERDLTSAITDDVIGKSVTIRVTEDEKDDGTYWSPRAVFCSAYKRIGGEDKAARLAAFVNGCVASKPSASVASSNAKPSIAAPEQDADDMPF